MGMPLLDRTSSVPLFEQIARHLSTQIEAGELAPRAKIPSEATLMTQFEVSRMTVRQAIGHLRAQGLVVARHGSGVFVHEKTPQRTVHPQDDPEDNGDRDPIVTEAVPPQSIRALLGVRHPKTKVITISTMARDAGMIVSTSTYLTADVAKTVGITTARRGRPTGTVTDVFAAGGRPVHRWVDRVSTRRPEGWEQALMGLSEGDPVLVHTRVAHDADRHVLFVRETAHPSSVVLTFDAPAT